MLRNGIHDERRLRRIRTAAFVFWLCVVWGHSLLSGEISSAESSRFVFLVRPLFEMFGCHDEQIMTFFIRKGAHFTEYAILSCLALRMAWAWFGRTRAAWLLAGFLWVAVPVLDEMLQLIVPGRSGNPRDVLIDMCGGLVGLLVTYAFARLRHGRSMREG